MRVRMEKVKFAAMERKICKLAEVGSTNSYMKEHAEEFGHGDAVCAYRQTGGRGQRGNSWEAEEGKNVTMSVMLRWAGMPARLQFSVSEAVALGVAETAQRHIGMEVRVKWPNDIYVDDRKLCGILIENSLRGSELGYTVAGVGLNVNQKEFRGGAPNPVSMAELSGRQWDVDALTAELASAIVELAEDAATEEGRQRLHERYMRRLWRGEGLHRYRDTATGEIFEAGIASIGPMGHITLRTAEGESRQYAFKEVEALLKEKND